MYVQYSATLVARTQLHALYMEESRDMRKLQKDER